MRKSGFALAGAALTAWGCSTETPVQPADEPEPALRTVSNRVASVCNLPSCAPGFGGGSPAPRDPPPPAPVTSGTIVFESDLVGGIQIWTMDGDGGNRRQLTTSESFLFAVHPKVSDDGSRIVFQGWSEGDTEIYTMDIDGGNLAQLTDNELIDEIDPTWTPDGTQIVFESHLQSDWEGTSALYLMDADGSGVKLLKDGSSYDFGADVSPDGTRIAWVSGFTVNIMNIDGTNEIELPGGWDLNPQWSPSGDQVVLQSNRGGNWELVLFNADGTEAAQRTTSDANEHWPTWSPDGSRIAYLLEDGPIREIYTMNADGTGVTQLTDNDALDANPSWGP